VGKPVELRFRTIKWARLQVTEGASWGLQIWTRFDDRNGNNDNYGKTSFFQTPVYIVSSYHQISLR